MHNLERFKQYLAAQDVVELKMCDLDSQKKPLRYMTREPVVKYITPMSR